MQMMMLMVMLAMLVMHSKCALALPATFLNNGAPTLPATFLNSCALNLPATFLNNCALALPATFLIGGALDGASVIASASADSCANIASCGVSLSEDLKF